MLIMISLIFFVLSLLCLWRLFHQIRKRRWMSTLRYTGLLVISLALLLAVSSISYSIALFHNLTYQIPIATVGVQAESKPSTYKVTIILPEGAQHTYLLVGDDWLMGANVLVWKPWVQAVGIKNQYQLDFLTARFYNNQKDMTTLVPNYDLNPMSNNPFALWVYQHALLPYLVDTVEGSAVYMPLQNQAHYQVFLGASGLMAKKE